MTATSGRPQVSVVIPSYNHADFVGQAIQSALDQDVDLEVVVVDDASGDRSRAVISAFSDPRLKFLPQSQNRGPSVALNIGIEAARGAFITALGSDDFYLPQTLQKQLAFLHDHPEYDAVFGMPLRVDEAGRPLKGGYAEFQHPFVGKVASRYDWLRHFFLIGNCLCHPTVMLRRGVHETVGLYDPRLLNLQDFDMWVRMLLAGMSFFVLSADLTGRRVFSNRRNLSAPGAATSVRAQFEFIQVIKRYRSMPSSDLYQAFGPELRMMRAPPDLNAASAIAAVAATSGNRAMQYFAVESLYEGLGNDARADCRLLFALASKLDPFGSAGSAGSR
jgi:glycosyltransferase involved in cell wall biosynthesis